MLPKSLRVGYWLNPAQRNRLITDHAVTELRVLYTLLKPELYRTLDRASTIDVYGNPLPVGWEKENHSTLRTTPFVGICRLVIEQLTDSTITDNQLIEAIRRGSDVVDALPVTVLLPNEARRIALVALYRLYYSPESKIQSSKK